MSDRLKKRCVVIGGAQIGNYPAVKQYLRPDDFFIYCDCGIKHRELLQAEPDLIVGDFDSCRELSGQTAAPGLLNAELNYRGEGLSAEELRRIAQEPESGAKILTLPHDKFDTDSVYGVREGIARGFDDFLLLGMIGQRFDHSLSNLYILVLLRSAGKHGMIVDDYSEMELVGAETALIEDRFSGFSLVNITGTARRITIENAKYSFIPGDEIPCDYQYGISNEVIPGSTARVTVREGCVLLVRNRTEDL